MYFEKYIEDGLITMRTHPLDKSLRIYNYTPKTLFHSKWDEHTMRARGLIMRDEKVIAEPFRKFFNLNEHQYTQLENLPKETPEITEKIDGALGILYPSPDGQLAISTRGSFESDEALWATKFLRENVLPKLQRRSNVVDVVGSGRWTIMFEIVSPAVEHILKYLDGIYLIGMRDMWSLSKPLLLYSKVIQLGTSLELPLFPNFIVHTPLDLLPMDAKDVEGWVAMYPKAQLLVKIKTPKYREIHRYANAVTLNNILDLLEGNTYDDVVSGIPNEVKEKANEIKNKLVKKYNEVEGEIYRWFHSIPEFINLGERKDKALWIKQEVPIMLQGPVFLLLDSREPNIWKLIRKHYIKGDKIL